MTASTRPQVVPVHDDTRQGLTSRAIRRAFRDNLLYVLGRRPEAADPQDAYMALAYTVRDRLLTRWLRTAETYQAARARTVCYLSPEYLPGPHLGNTLLALGIWDQTQRAMEKLGYDLETLLAMEPEPGLGNGELGRLASCFMDSMATLGIPAVGYGIRYEFSFDQEIRDGWQVETADPWLHAGNPWEIPRPEISFPVGYEGRSTFMKDARGRTQAKWTPGRFVQGTAYDTPIPGYAVGNVNLLRLWKARAAEAFDPQSFHAGDYVGAVLDKCASEAISKVLHPSDEHPGAKHLLLEQQYFFVSCSLQDMIRSHREAGLELTQFHRHFAVQLHDAHAALAVPELMRLLVDEHGLDWDRAWEVTTGTLATTSHTLLPEAAPSWPVDLVERLLPRHLEILYEVNHRFLETAQQRRPEATELARRISLIDETAERRVRLLHVAAVGSHGVNGTAALHTDELREDVLEDWESVWPGKIRNVTHGVTPRRFLLLANPGLSRLITDAIGDGWVRDLGKLRDLEPLAADASFRDAWQTVKRKHRETLAAETQLRAGVPIDPESFMDAQVDRFHESKRQLLNLLHVVTLLHRIRRDPGGAWPSRTVLFAGKAAPGNGDAQKILRLVHGVAAVVNADPEVRARLRVAFLPGHNVKHALRLYAGVDLSEQIATGAKEAGTDGMKFALNGALTIGTPDGVNPEIRRAVGPDHYFQFGLNVEGSRRLLDQGYRPRDRYEGDSELREAVDRLADGTFVDGDSALLGGIVERLLSHDPWLVLADYRSYLDAQEEAARVWRDPERWTRASILTVARMGAFSSDRAVQEYAAQIWHVQPVPVPLAEGEDPASGE